MSIEIADAQSEQTSAIAAILSDWLLATVWMPKLHTAAEDREFIAELIATETVRVALIRGWPVGFLARDGVDVTALYVAEGYRRQGIGAALLTDAKAMGHLSLWTFQENLPARAFFLREGFVEAERTNGARNEERLPDLRMVWTAETTTQP
jgi:GNAT superfamily N-acetyltransferase